MKTGGKGNFFAVDRWTWSKVCDTGNLNAAEAYLTLAAGTGGDNLSTRWSSTALKTYAGIGLERGKATIADLVNKGFIRTAEGSTAAKPRYQLMTPKDVYASSLKTRFNATAEGGA